MKPFHTKFKNNLILLIKLIIFALKKLTLIVITFKLNINKLILSQILLRKY